MTWYVWDSSGNSASIHERLQPVNSYLSMNGVDDETLMVAKSYMVYYACFVNSGSLGDGIHES